MMQLLSFGLFCLLFSHASVSFGAEKFVKGEYLVKMKSGVDSVAAAEILSAGGFVTSQVSPENHLYKVTSQFSTEETLQQLNHISSVEYAEPNYILSIDQLPNDKKFKDQWGLKNSKGFDVKAESLWNYSVSSKDIVIAVIDTGISTTHPDLKDNLWINQEEVKGQPGIDDDGNGFIDDINGFHFVYPKSAVTDKNGHGSHCAGIIAARGNNEIGTSGLLWQAKLMAVGFLDAKGSGSTENGIKAIDYAVRMGARVISASWGGGGSSTAMKEAIIRARDAGVVFVAAAGNESANNDSKAHFPSNYDVSNVISVAAITKSGKLASFSNRGVKTVHIAAPGDGIMSTYMGTGYASLSGTSMATPFVAAAAAMTLANHSNYTPVKVRQVLMDSSTKLDSLNGKVMSGGLLNAMGTL